MSARESIVFAAAGLTDKSQRFAGVDAQRHFVYRPHPTRSRGQLCCQPMHIEQNAHSAMIDRNFESRNTKLEGISIVRAVG